MTDAIPMEAMDAWAKMEESTNWRPAPDLQELSPVIGLRVEIANVVRGAAVDVCVAHQDGMRLRWCHEPRSIGPGTEAEIAVLPGDGQEVLRHELFTVREAGGGWAFVTGRPKYVMLCLDESGSRVYRFASGSPRFDVWEVAQEAPPWAKAAADLWPFLRADSLRGS